MDEHRGASAPQGGGADSELNFRAIFGFALGLLVVSAISFAVVRGISAWQKGRLVHQDAPPPALAEARLPTLPAGPLLQADPETDLKSLRAREDAVLSGWAWTDASRTHARIPVERALEIVAARGFPPRTAAPGPVPVPEVKQ